MLRHLEHKEIDKRKWDEGMSRSFNGMAHCYSWFLDIACPGWEALTDENYRILFPLPARKKIGISYLFQPYFIYRLDVFCPDEKARRETAPEIFSFMEKEYSYADINLDLPQENLPEAFSITRRKAQCIDLRKGYPSPSKSLRSNLVKAKRAGLYIADKLDESRIAGHVYNDWGKRIKGFKEEQLDLLNRMIMAKDEFKQPVVRAVYDPEGELCAGGYFLLSNRRIIYLTTFATEAGKKSGAVPFLRHSFFQEFSGKDIFFDFNGSNVPGIAESHYSYGAEDQYYYKLRYNKLPWPLKLLKK